MIKDVEHKRVFAILDRIAHPSTTELDREQSIAGLNRMLKGKMPSDILTPNTSRSKHRADGLRQEIAELRDKLAEVEAAKNSSDRAKQCELESLIAQIAQLQAQVDTKDQPTSPCDFYTYHEVIQTMVQKFGKHHGVPAALVERNSQLLQYDNTIGKITSHAMQQWRKLNRYPRYVVEQINNMSKNDLLPRGCWDDGERRFLMELYSSNDQQSNKQLAMICSERFGRLVTECSIKGELNRLRQNGKVKAYRSR